ncbi:MAG: carboxymuconolactone decarboxylase family protein [Novosphingobium sp.]|nr:carboxymuconolactone decarboxylase family protein [Novosphingobium sp.]
MKLPTSRINGVYWESDYPYEPDDATAAELTELFDYVAQSYPEPEGRYISGGHAGIAQLAQNPRIALSALKLVHAVLGDRTWAKSHFDLRELIVQTVNVHFRSQYCFQAHMEVARLSGLTDEQQAMLPFWETAEHVYTEEHKLIIEYTLAVCKGQVPDALFARVVDCYGEKEAIECTAVIATWAFWAMILNATGTSFDFGFDKPVDERSQA